MRKSNSFTKISIPVILFLLFLWVGTDLYSRSGGVGVSGLTASNSAGCNCHGSSASSATVLSVQSTSGNFKFSPNDEAEFIITVTNSSKTAAGINIAVKTTETGNTNAGSLSFPSGSGLRTESGEITHSSPKSFAGETYTEFSFKWTAPSTPGVYYLRAISNAVNESGDETGDQWNWMTPKTITVAGATVTAPIASSKWCVNTTQEIKWTQTGIENLKIELSTDGGSSFPITISNSTSASTGSFNWSIPGDLNPGTQYKIRLTDVSASNIKGESATFAIAGTAEITAHPTDKTVCEQTPVTFSVTATGSVASYEWRKNGTAIPNSNSPNLTFNFATMEDQADYTVIVTPDCGAPITSSSAKLVVNESVGIAQQPFGVDACEGDNVEIVIKSKGFNRKVEWFKGTQLISGASGDTLRIQNVTSADVGSYTAKVSGDCGNAVTSVASMLTLGTVPTISEHPKSQSICENHVLTLKVTALGTGLKYQWKKNGINISGAEDLEYTIQSFKTSDAGDYHVVVQGICGSPIESDAANITLNIPPVITTHPVSQTVDAGGFVNLTVSATGKDLNYQWFLNDEMVEGQTTPTLSIPSVSVADAGDYYCEIINTCGTVKSNVAKLTVNVIEDGKLSLSVNSYDLGIIEINKSYQFTIVELVRNVGNKPIQVNELTFEDDLLDGTMTIGFPTPQELGPGEKADLFVDVTPTTIGSKSYKLTFGTDDGQEGTIVMTALAVEYSVDVSTNTLDFGTVLVDERPMLELILTNNSNSTVKINSVSIIGDDDGVFSIAQDYNGTIIAAQSTQGIRTNFMSDVEGDYSAQLEIGFDEIDKITIDMKAVSTATSVEEIANYLNNLRIYPNPTTENLNIELSAKHDLSYTLKLFNQSGELLNSKDGFALAGNNNLSWNIKDIEGKSLSAGTYLIMLEINGSVVMDKVIFIK